MHQRGRGLIQQVRVIDDQHRRTLARRLKDSPPGEHHHPQPIEARGIQRRQQVRERAKRNTAGRTRPRHPHAGTRAHGRADHLARQARLADPGRTHHDHPAGLARAQGPLNDAELLVPTDQPDGVHTSAHYEVAGAPCVCQQQTLDSRLSAD